MQRPRTHDQRLRKRRGGRAPADTEYDRKRKGDPYLARAAQIRSSSRWQKVRASQLRREPLCEHCREKGRTTLAQQVDHIVGLNELLRAYAFPEVLTAVPPRAFDPANLASLCTTCHAAKSAKERTRA